MGKGGAASQGNDRPERRHQDAAEDDRRCDAGRQVLYIRGRVAATSPAAPHRPANPRAHAADRHRARPELRDQQA